MKHSRYLKKRVAAVPQPEPRVVTADVARLLAEVIDTDTGREQNIEQIATKAETSPRTVYRVLSLHTETISLDLADRLVMAVDRHLNDCEVVE